MHDKVTSIIAYSEWQAEREIALRFDVSRKELKFDYCDARCYCGETDGICAVKGKKRFEVAICDICA